MPSDSGDRRSVRLQPLSGSPPEHEHLPCPRCNSINTKFCYYNNYNHSQPRHFCKSCRRYWTQGGTLRNIPVGGGSRKNAKRSRTSPASHDPIRATTISVSPAGEHDMSVPLRGDVDLPASFTSLLNTQGPGFFALGGFGLGLGSGFEDMEFGLGRGVWPLSEDGEGGVCGGYTWHLGSSGDGGIVDGDWFSWPELTTRGKRLK